MGIVARAPGGLGMPTSASSSTARSQAARRDTGRWSRTASAIWLPP